MLYIHYIRRILHIMSLDIQGPCHICRREQTHKASLAPVVVVCPALSALEGHCWRRINLSPFASAICNFLSDTVLIRSGYIWESRVKKSFLITTMVCISSCDKYKLGLFPPCSLMLAAAVCGAFKCSFLVETRATRGNATVSFQHS